MKSLLPLLLASYCFVVQFGSLFRYGSGEGALGVSTGIVLIVIFLGFNGIPRQIRMIPVLSAIALLLGWFVLSSSLSPTGYLGAYRRLGQLMLYLCLAAAISSRDFTDKQLKLVAYSVAIGLLLSSGLTIIDYQGWANIPGCNEVVISSRVGGSNLDRVSQAGGFFPRRSAMAAVFSLSATVSVIMALAVRGWSSKVLFAVSGLSGILSLFLTHNRSGIAAIVLAMFVYVFLNKSFTFGRRIKTIAFSGVVGIGLLIVLITYFPAQVDIYKGKLPMFFPEASKDYSEEQARGDSVRSDNLMTAFKNITSNPFGNGLGYIPHPELGYVDAHSSFTILLWAGGVVTLLWMVPFSFRLFKLLFARVNLPPDVLPYFDAFRSALVAFFFNCMVHESLGTGLFWIFLAVVISIRYQGNVDLSAMQRSQYYPMVGVRQAGSF